MSKLHFRVLIMALLVATVALKISATPPVIHDVRAGVTAVLARKGATLRDDPSPARSDLARPMLFDFPGCEGALQVIPVTLSLQESALFSIIVKEGYSRRFVYRDRVWLTEDRLGMRIEWLKGKALSIMGLGRFAGASTALLVAEPPHCNVAQLVDWSPVWYRGQNLAAGKGGTP